MLTFGRLIVSLALLALLRSAAVAQEAAPYARLNTAGDDYALTFRTTCDGVEAWFTTNRAGGGARSRRIVVSAMTAGGAGPARELEEPINQAIDRGPMQVYLDGTPAFASCDPGVGVFASNRLVDGRNMDNDLYEMRRDGSAWRVSRLDVSSSAWDDSPALSADGRFLYFASDRAAPGTGETDLYMARRVSGGWSAPELLSTICEPGVREQTPSIGPDGTLYFASDRSGDHDIWRAPIDRASGLPLRSDVGPIVLPQVNRSGSDEGHPTFSPGGGWLIFTSNRASDGGTDYDLYFVRLGAYADTVRLRALLRTRESVPGVDEPDDITRPLGGLTLTTTDLATRTTLELVTRADGSVDAILPRAIGVEPGDDRRLRQIEVRAVTGRADRISSTDTLIFAMGYGCALAHTLFVWDTTILYTPACRQNFPVTNVEFFITGYWCPTTSRYAAYAPCQSPFPDPSCARVETPPLACDDNELYDFTMVPARVDQTRQPGLCVRLNEIGEHGPGWARKVDSAVDRFVDNMQVGLKKPCIQRAIDEGKPIEVEIVGWTDPRPIDPGCVYTGPTIDFGAGRIALAEIEKKPWIRKGVLAHRTRFRESPAAGNQMLSDLRAYYTARMLDTIFAMSIPLYAQLRARGQITVVARGEAVSQERIAMERQRSVNVIINTAVDQAAIEEIRRQAPGSSVAICGGDCVAGLLCRAVEMGAR